MEAGSIDIHQGKSTKKAFVLDTWMATPVQFKEQLNRMYIAMKIVFSVLLIIMLIACEKSAEPSSALAVAVAPTTTGTVLETIDVDSYTYIRLATDGRELWLATSPTPVGEGDLVQFTGGVTMQDFYSTTLDRTFEQILFVGRVEPAGSTAGSGEVTARAPDPHAGLEPMPAGTENPAILDSLEGGISIAGIIADPGKYEGKNITLRGRVIKVSANIMGKNWVTVQDGTGVAPDDQLIATTLQTVAVGDELTLSGVVRNNIDLGYGYNYEVLLEDAVFE